MIDIETVELKNGGHGPNDTVEMLQASAIELVERMIAVKE